MIAVVAPYAPTEVTWAAIRVANVAAAHSGQDVRYVCYGSIHRGLHAHWDARVLSGKRFKNAALLQKAATLVYFGFPPEVIVRKEARRLFVPISYAIDAAHAKDWLKPFNAVICPSRAYRDALSLGGFGCSEESEKLYYTVWSAETEASRRDGALDLKRVRACVHCDSPTINACSGFILQLVDDLLAGNPMLELTVLSEKSWCRQDRKRQRQMQTAWGRRLCFLRQTSPYSWSTIYQQHDWVVVPSIRADFGACAAKAIAAGVPVIANDVSPFAEMIANNVNGLLVACDLQTSQPAALRAPTAVPHAGHWLETCNRAFRGHKLLFHLQGQDWEQDQRRQAFDNAWLKFLEIA